MATISKIEIEGFKAFPNYFSLELGDKNLLMYGENGSGKSSIYYALHALLQSVFKDDKGAKYFKTIEDSSTGEGSFVSDENLVNIYRSEDVKKNVFQPYIKITLDNGNVWKLDRGGLQSENGVDYSEIRMMNKNAAFINHSYISRFHSARNSEDINLWNVFVKDILPFCVKTGEDNSLADVFYDIVDEKPHGKKEIDNYIKRIGDFNNRLYNEVIAEINKKATDIYNRYFKNEDDPELVITLRYFADDDKINNPLSEEFFLAFDKFHGTQYSLRYPRIGIEVVSDSQPINKPQSFFNEAKLTAIALSVRFALLNIDNPEDSGLLALDDMLISLDMSNRMKVINYLLNVSIRNYQICLFTHDRLFYHTFKRIIETQYNNGKWIFGGLYLNDWENPISPEFNPETKSRIDNIHEAYSRHDYFRCGMLLRQLCERCLKELLPDSLRTKPDSQTGLSVEKNLDEQIFSLEDFCIHEGIDFTPFKNLKLYKDLFLNSTAHNDITSPFYRNEIKACMKALEKLNKINRSKEIKCHRDFSFRLLASDGKEHIIGLRLREKLLLLEFDSTKQISYYSKCEIRKDISEDGEIEVNEGFESLYEAYKSVCAKHGVEVKGDLLDILKDRDRVLRDKI